MDKMIFTGKAMKQLRSPEDMDQYLKVTNPGVWTVLAACGALLFGLLMWGFFGTVTSSVSTRGVCLDGEFTICFLSSENVANVNEGDAAMVEGIPMHVTGISDVPLSREEQDNLLLDDYLVSVLCTEDWMYWVMFEPTKGDKLPQINVPVPVYIMTEVVRPISLILGEWGWDGKE